MRPRMSEDEIKFLLQLLLETKESIDFAVDLKKHKKSADPYITECRRKALVVDALIRRFESLLNGGRKHLKREARLVCGMLAS